MHQFKKLALATAVGSLLMTATAVHADVSYNQNISTANNNTVGPWSSFTPAYTGKLPATWAVNLETSTSSYSISTADALASGAPTIATFNNKWNPASSWGNALDFGLIDLAAPATVTFTVQADASQSSTFTPAFTIFSGWADPGTGNKHGPWNANPSAPSTLGATGLTYQGHAATATAGGSATLTIPLAAGKYSMWVGGNGTGNISTGQTYVASIAAVPEPEEWAMMLFGIPLMGWVTRRKQALDKQVLAA